MKIFSKDRADPDDLPDLLIVPYTVLWSGLLHPTRILKYKKITRIATGILYTALYIIPIMFSIYEMIQVNDVVKVTINVELTAGYIQVT